MVAEELGLNYEDVVVHKSDTSGTLFDVPTHASRGTYGAGLAVYKASQKVKQVLLDVGFGDSRDPGRKPRC